MITQIKVIVLYPTLSSLPGIFRKQRRASNRSLPGQPGAHSPFCAVVRALGLGSWWCSLQGRGLQSSGRPSCFLPACLSAWASPCLSIFSTVSQHAALHPCELTWHILQRGRPSLPWRNGHIYHSALVVAGEGERYNMTLWQHMWAVSPAQGLLERKSAFQTLKSNVWKECIHVGRDHGPLWQLLSSSHVSAFFNVFGPPATAQAGPGNRLRRDRSHVPKLQSLRVTNCTAFPRPPVVDTLCSMRDPSALLWPSSPSFWSS